MSLRRFLSPPSWYHLLNVSSWGKGISTSLKTDYFSLWCYGHQLDKLSMLEPFSEYWVYFSLLSFLYNPFCNSILLIKDQTFCLLWRKCPVTYKQKTNFLWDSNDRQQSSTGSKLNQVTVSKRCWSPQTMPVFICKSSINICFSFSCWCSFSFSIYTFADKHRLSSAKYDF